MGGTRIALLGTLSHLHERPIRYDLAELTRTVAKVHPDLLGVELEPDEFERGDLSRAPVEVGSSLAPLARRTDIVLVPIGAASPRELRARYAGFRALLIRILDASMRLVQRTANEPRRINSALVGHVCGFICDIEKRTCGKEGRQAWETTNNRLLGRLVEAARRDPDARLLAAVQCRRKHWLEARLRKMPDLDVVRYWEL